MFNPLRHTQETVVGSWASGDSVFEVVSAPGAFKRIVIDEFIVDRVVDIQEDTLYPEGDSYMSSSSPETKYGEESTILMGCIASSLYFNSWYSFDVSSIVKLVTTATLRLYLTVIDTTNELLFEYARGTRAGSIVEVDVTWNEYAAFSSWTAGGGDYSGDPPVPVTHQTSALPTINNWFELVGFKTLVQDAIDNRSSILDLIGHSSAGTSYYVTDTRGNAHPPELVVTSSYSHMSFSFQGVLGINVATIAGPFYVSKQPFRSTQSIMFPYNRNAKIKPAAGTDGGSYMLKYHIEGP